MTSQEKAFRIYEFVRYDVSLLDGSEALINAVAKQAALYVAENARIEMVKLQNHEKAIYWLDVKREIKAIA
jgi:hypothetical protein